ncbi:unnamed protein product [Lymnaea stagnalis]|uniref:Uncharacterized protein n=1 Tax=Lymnaea stagnalis TaxID=6523 RepID=A0AAV2HIG1_LYMST
MAWYADDMYQSLFAQLIGAGDVPLLQTISPCKSDDPVCNCPRQLSGRSDVLMFELLLSENLTLSNQQVDAILSLSESIPESDVIFLSASSSNHYDEMQAMFHNLHTVVSPLMPDMRVVFFDIGLTETQRIQTEKYCRCHVIRFPFEKFRPLLEDRFCYFWKPLIIRALIGKVRKGLVYQDSSVRWTSHIKPLLERGAAFGLQYHVSDVPPNVSVDRLKQMSNFFGEELCAFRHFPELDGSNGIFGNLPFVIRALIEPWAKCALDAACMCPDQPEAAGSLGDQLSDGHRSHGFDRATLKIVAAKLFDNALRRVITLDNKAIDTVRRGLAMPDYFNSIVNKSAGHEK